MYSISICFQNFVKNSNAYKDKEGSRYEVQMINYNLYQMILQFVQFLKKIAHLNWPVKNLSVTYTIVQLPPPTTLPSYVYP